MKAVLALFALGLSLATAQAQTIEQVSAKYVGLPYVLGPLGEGHFDVFDQYPLYRFDEFDCTTFVETMMALAGATDDAGVVNMRVFESRLRKIRYKNGKVSYFTRNHFPELDWIPNNEAAGWVTDVTADIAGKETEYSEATIDKRGWYQARTASDIRPPRSATETQTLLAKLRSLGDAVVPQTAKIAYIPIATLIGPDGNAPRLDLLKLLPSGAIINIVRENWMPAGEGTPMIISHQMILVRVGGALHLRHASPEHGVIEVPFVDYLKQFLQSPTIRGINVLRFGQK